MVGKDVDFAADLLRSSKLVGMPTETVYGLAANALDPRAVATIFEVKQRPSFDPLIIHVDEWEKLDGLVEKVPSVLRQKLEHFVPGPLTFLLPRTSAIPDIVTAGLPEVAIRMPRHPMARRLLSKLDFPLAAPSANPFGYISPTQPSHVVDQLGSKIPYVLDGGPCQVGIESTIIRWTPDNALQVLRKGGLALEKLKEIFGDLDVFQHSTSNPKAPGMLKSHYAPKTPFLLGDIEQLVSEHQSKKIAFLGFDQSTDLLPKSQQFLLSAEGDLSEAAAGLFAQMRALDQMGFDIIIASPFPERGLGRAINDRLKRAAN